MWIKGEEVTDEQIAAWVAEAEVGYPVEELRKRGRKPAGVDAGRVVPVRLDSDLLAALDGRAAHDHASRSEIIRAAIRAYVA